jgi:hypothetical protein
MSNLSTYNRRWVRFKGIDKAFTQVQASTTQVDFDIRAFVHSFPGGSPLMKVSVANCQNAMLTVK